MHSKIIKDSLNAHNKRRLTTFVVEFPRFINAEFLRHRALSFSSASSRAIPAKKVIQNIQDNTAIPVYWGKNQKGMQAKEQLQGSERKAAIDAWLDARDSAIEHCKRLIDLGVHKQIANRVLEPFQNIKLIVSGTEWENFFALRAHPDAQPEFQELAYRMLNQYNNSKPERIEPVKYATCSMYKAWNMSNDDTRKEMAQHAHIPFGDKMEYITADDKLRVASSRCARISYNTFDGDMNIEKDLELFERLMSGNPKHASPTEHIAFAIEEDANIGNFQGWYQFRKMFTRETSKDERVIKHD